MGEYLPKYQAVQAQSIIREIMRYLVKARLKKGRQKSLWQAIKEGTLGRGSVAGGEYIRNMNSARQLEDGTVCWVEVCFCPTPLQEERPYWEAFFELVKIKNAHNRNRCQDINGEEPWACTGCDCTKRLENRIAELGSSFVSELRDDDTE